MKIPNNKPFFSGREIEYIKDALDREQVSGDGYYTGLAASMLENKLSADKILMTTSGTHALEMAAMLIELDTADEVIMPSFTFPSTANAVMLRGARPVFTEVEEGTLNIDPEDMERKISARTRAIIPVHYAGVGSRMDRIMDIAQRHGLYVIEDSAQAVNAKFKGKYLGTLGHFGCLSFHGTKNFTSGEGGALLINSVNPSIVEKAEIIREKGTNRSRFTRGEIDKYYWIDTGSSYAPSDVLMAILCAQLNDADYIISQRKAVHDYYCSRLAKYAQNGKLRLMHIPPECESNYHLFYIVLSNENFKKIVMHELNQRGVSAVTHFVPLHSSPMGIKLGYRPEDLALTEGLSRRLLRLPMYTGITENEMEYVMDNLEDILRGV